MCQPHFGVFWSSLFMFCFAALFVTFYLFNKYLQFWHFSCTRCFHVAVPCDHTILKLPRPEAFPWSLQIPRGVVAGPSPAALLLAGSERSLAAKCAPQQVCFSFVLFRHNSLQKPHLPSTRILPLAHTCRTFSRMWHIKNWAAFQKVYWKVYLTFQ